MPGPDFRHSWRSRITSRLYDSYLQESKRSFWNLSIRSATSLSPAHHLELTKRIGTNVNFSEHCFPRAGCTRRPRKRRKVCGHVGGDLQRHWTVAEIRRVASRSRETRRDCGGNGRNYRYLDGVSEQQASRLQSFSHTSSSGPPGGEKNSLESCAHLEEVDSRKCSTIPRC